MGDEKLSSIRCYVCCISDHSRIVSAIIDSAEKYPSIMGVEKFDEAEPLKHRYTPENFREMGERPNACMLLRRGRRSKNRPRPAMVGMYSAMVSEERQLTSRSLATYHDANDATLEDFTQCAADLSKDARADWCMVYPMINHEGETTVGARTKFLEGTPAGSTSARGDYPYLGEFGLPLPPPVFVLGPMYVDLIGLDRLLRVPAGKVTQLAPDQVMFRLATSFDALTSDWDAFMGRRRAVMEAIGREYFVGEDGTPSIKIPKELQGTRENAQRVARRREERDRAEQARLAALPPKLTTLEELLEAIRANPDRIVLHATERGHGIIDRARKEFVVQPPREGKRWVAALAEMGVEGYEPSVERS